MPHRPEDPCLLDGETEAAAGEARRAREASKANAQHPGLRPTALHLCPPPETHPTSPSPPPPPAQACQPQSPSRLQFMQGPGLAFAAFSQAVSLLPGGSFWAIVFFLTLCIMELRTFTIVSEGIIFPLQNCMSIFRNHLSLLSGDSCPADTSSGVHVLNPAPDSAPYPDFSVAQLASAVVVVCLGGFLGSIIFTSHAGSYIMSLFHENLVPLILVVIVAFQNMGLACVYGAKRCRPSPGVPSQGSPPHVSAVSGHGLPSRHHPPPYSRGVQLRAGSGEGGIRGQQWVLMAVCGGF